MTARTGLMTYKEAAAELRVSDRTVRRLIARKKLASIKLGHNCRRISPDALARCQEKLATRTL